MGTESASCDQEGGVENVFRYRCGGLLRRAERDDTVRGSPVSRFAAPTVIVNVGAIACLAVMKFF